MIGGLVGFVLAAVARVVGWEPFDTSHIWDACPWCGEEHPPEVVGFAGVNLAACPNVSEGSLFYVQR